MAVRVLPALLIGLILVGCGKAADDAADASFKAPSAAPAQAGAGEAMTDQGETTNSTTRLALNVTPVAPRLVVRDADLSLRVVDIVKGERSVTRIAQSFGGQVEASQGGDLAGPDPHLSITLRVPEGRFESVVESLETLGTRLGKTVSTEDVTAQAVDLDARLKSLRVQEDAYRAILGAARKISDVLEVQERLTGVRTEIEQIVASRRDLGDRAARSKVVVELTQSARPNAPAPEPDWMSQTWGDATGSLRAAGRALASIGLWLVAMLPIWLLVALVAGWAVRRNRGKTRVG